MSISNALYVFVGAGLGGLLRYVIGAWAPERWAVSFPFPILLINVLGAFLIGFLVSAGAQREAISSDLILFLGVGVLGGFTTFSTLSYDSVVLFQQGQVLYAVVNMFGSVILGVTAAALGIIVGRTV